MYDAYFLFWLSIFLQQGRYTDDLKKQDRIRYLGEKGFLFNKFQLWYRRPQKTEWKKVLLSLLKAIKSVAFDRENHENLSFSPHNK